MVKGTSWRWKETHKLAGILCNIKDMGEGVKESENKQDHMVWRCLAFSFPLASPSDPMSYPSLSILVSASPTPPIKR